MLVIWKGERPPATLVEDLQKEGVGIRLGAEDDATEASRSADPLAQGPAPMVLFTRADEVPEAPGGGRWIWLTPEPALLPLALEASRRGAYDVIALSEPASRERLARRVGELCAREPVPGAEPAFVTRSAAARELLRQISRAARTSMPVLLTGATGTGKEFAARLVHRWSGRPGPWMPINCAAIPNDLMESELFGHVRGAFSGAVASVDGRLLAAEGGTVFLDEIDDTPLSTQVKLLRVLEDSEVTRVGETRARKVDFRLIAATNRDLLELVARGQFGRDLYERLAIVRIDLPPLTERREDVPDLAAMFVQRFFALQELPPRPIRIGALALEALCAHPWPGNIRELRNVIFQALVNKSIGDELLLSDLPRLIRPGRAAPLPAQAEDSGTARPDRSAERDDPGEELRDSIREEMVAGRFRLRRRIEELERMALLQALDLAHGSPARAARWLGEVGRGSSREPGSTVRAMMRRLGVRYGGGGDDPPPRGR